MKGTTETVDPETAGKRGRQVVSCMLQGPRYPATHWQILCEIRGLYGKRKYVKFHLTGAGYFAIYNAELRGDDSAFTTHKEAPPKEGVTTTDDLYRIFHQIAARRGPHRDGYGCETFAKLFFEAITGVKTEGEDDFM